MIPFTGKPQLTEKNHFEYGFIHGHPHVFFSKLSLPDHLEGDALDASAIAARKIYDDAAGVPLNLCISGGIDSEVMMRAFLKAKVPFRTTVLRFKNALNEYDIFNAVDYSRSHGIEPEIIDLDVIDFLERGKHLDYGRKYRCQSPQLAVHLWLLDQIDGFPVMSGNFIYPEQTAEGLFYLGLPGDLHCTAFRYFEVNQRAGVPWFLIYTPEMTRAFFNTPLIASQFSGRPEDVRSFTYAVKCEVYRQGGFDVKPRPDKYTGFENIRHQYDLASGTTHGVKFDQLFRHPLVALNPLPEEYLQIIDGSPEPFRN